MTRGASLGYPAPVLFFLSSPQMISYSTVGSKVCLLPVLAARWENTGAADTSAHFTPLICSVCPVISSTEYLWACTV